MTRTNLISTVIVGLASTAANAGLVYVNPTSMSAGTVNSTEVGAKYRLSNSNWDMSLDNGAGTSSSSNFLSAGLGNNNQLSGRTYSFTLTHTAGQGFVFTMLDTASNAATTLSWGTFASPPGGTTAAALNGQTPNGSFNSLLLEAKAGGNNASMQFSNLAFTSATLLNGGGSWQNGTLTPSTSGPGQAAGTWSQRLIADSDMSQHTWTLSGLLHGTRTGSSGGDELTKITISGQDVAVVPTPGAMALLLTAGLVARRRRR